MNKILLDLLERILGKAVDPGLKSSLLQQYQSVQEQDLARLQQEMALKQQQLQQQIFAAPRQAGKSSALKGLAGMQPGSVQYLPPQAQAQQAFSPEEAAQRFLGRLMREIEEETEPEDTVMEFSLEE